MRRFVAVDLETTGVDPYNDYIVEVGMAGEDHITYRYFEMCFTLDFPHDRMTEGAAAVNGWGKREFGPTVDSDWAAAYIVSQLNDVYVVGKNPLFDTEFLRMFLAENGLHRVPWHHRLVDIGCLAWGWDAANANHENIAVWSLPPNTDKVEEMIATTRETVDGFHTALLDARWAYEAFRQIVPKSEED